MFLNGIPVQPCHHFFLSLSLFALFRCVTSYFIPMCNSEPAFAPLFVCFSLKGKTCRKAWCCTCERDFWQSCTPTNRNILAHLWIFIFLVQWNILLCHTESSVCVAHLMCIVMFCVSAVLTKVSLLIFLPSSCLLPLPLFNKSHIVAVFISTPSDGCLQLCSALSFLEPLSGLSNR